jgi:magnesium transporter
MRGGLGPPNRSSWSVVYGMNFAHMPETHWMIGYPLALASLVLYAVFKRRGWL